MKLSLERQNRASRAVSPGTSGLAAGDRTLRQSGPRQFRVEEFLSWTWAAVAAALVEQLGHPLDQVIGLDPDWPSLVEHRLASERPPFSRVAGISQNLPFSGNCFDLIFSSWILEHLSQPADDFRANGPGSAARRRIYFYHPQYPAPIGRIESIIRSF